MTIPSLVFLVYLCDSLLGCIWPAWLQAEELIKQEMLTMLHHDAVYNPTANQAMGAGPATAKGTASSQKAVVSQAQHLAYLERHPYRQYEDADLKQVGALHCSF